MSSFIHFLQSDPVIALGVSVFIFFITIFLVVKKWIEFPVTLLLLLLALTAGFIINRHHYFETNTNSTHLQVVAENDSSEFFHKQMLQAIDDLKGEVQAEKKNLQQVMSQIQDIFHQMENQKQKLQQFIDESHERFKTDYPTDKSAALITPSKESLPISTDE